MAVRLRRRIAASLRGEANDLKSNRSTCPTQRVLAALGTQAHSPAFVRIEIKKRAGACGWASNKVVHLTVLKIGAS